MAKVDRLTILLIAGLLLGCGKNAVEAPITAPPMDLALGKVDSRLVGAWKNPEETYTFSPDGTFKLHYDRMEQTGPSASNKARKVGDLSGKWSASPDALLLAVDKGENDTRHKLLFLLSEGGKSLELRATFLKKGQGTLYQKTNR